MNGKAGKFLDEERRLGDYPFNGPVGYLEVRYYCISLSIYIYIKTRGNDRGSLSPWFEFSSLTSPLFSSRNNSRVEREGLNEAGCEEGGREGGWRIDAGEKVASASEIGRQREERRGVCEGPRETLQYRGVCSRTLFIPPLRLHARVKEGPRGYFFPERLLFLLPSFLPPESQPRRGTIRDEKVK